MIDLNLKLQQMLPHTREEENNEPEAKEKSPNQKEII